MQLFGVGAFEALLVMVVALIVVGPQRFPEIARQGGRWFRVARRFTADITADFRGAIQEIEEEVIGDGDDLRAVREIGKEVEAGLRETKTDLDQLGRDTERAAEQAGTGAEASAKGAEQPDGGGEPSGEATPREKGASPSPSQPASSPPSTASPVMPQQRKTVAQLHADLSDATRSLRHGDSPGHEQKPDA